jgi:hypothetical protein
LLLILILIRGGVIENDQEQDQEQEIRLLIFNELQNTSLPVAARASSKPFLLQPDAAHY